MTKTALTQIDSSWSLFIDRDGVINKRIPNDYVVVWEQFMFHEGVLDAFSLFNQLFRHVFIVTNQQGIAKGLMTEIDLAILHHKMLSAIEEAGGRVDRIYHCPSLSTDNDPLRKPLPGMGLLAKKDYPDVDFSKTIILGDTKGDMGFGRNLGIITMLVSENGIFEDIDPELVDYRFKGIKAFTEFLLTLQLK
jgi:histidinol-phosphate phosphatase family protein